VLPPEVAARWATPLGVLCEERGERLGIAVTQRLCGGAKLIDHSRSMALSDENRHSPFVGLLQVEAF
jgi:predicted N-acetyltransferase YhbS